MGDCDESSSQVATTGTDRGPDSPRMEVSIHKVENLSQDHRVAVSQVDGARWITLEGHAIEVRLYTEDPVQDFLPTSGPVDLWCAPSGTGIRVDAGICSGQEISPFYDPMVAKIIASGPNRDIARLRLIEALNETVLFGPRHNRDFLVACLEKDCFALGGATTAFIAEEFAEGEISDPLPSFQDSAVPPSLVSETSNRSVET